MYIVNGFLLNRNRRLVRIAVCAIMDRSYFSSPQYQSRLHICCTFTRNNDHCILKKEKFTSKSPSTLKKTMGIIRVGGWRISVERDFELQVTLRSTSAFKNINSIMRCGAGMQSLLTLSMIHLKKLKKRHLVPFATN